MHVTTESLKTQGGGSRDVVRDGDPVGGGWVCNAQGRHRGEGRVEGGSKTELVQISSSVNEAEARDAEIVLRRFLSRLMVRKKSSFRKRGGVVGEDRLHGEESPD